MLWLIPVAAVGALAVAAVAKKSAIAPLPIDVAAILRGGLQSRQDPQLTAVLGQIATKYPRQVNVVYKAWGATKAHDGSLNVGADIDALYQNAFHSGDPAQMIAVAKALDVKYNFLSTHLTDVASLLANLATPAA